jgi:starch phosphorylase
MEIGLRAEIPTYSGGLGILAGDFIKSAADMNVPLVAVSLIYHKGYFDQSLDASGRQTEKPVVWHPADHLRRMETRVSVTIEGRTVWIGAWRLVSRGIGGFEVPVYFLDTDLPENDPGDRTFTRDLYGGDPRYRLCQEVILGVGGIRMLRALGHQNIDVYHMNEGHSSLLTLELVEEAREIRGGDRIEPSDLEAVRRRTAFTTHTPIPAGHDRFHLGLAQAVLGDHPVFKIRNDFIADGHLDMTRLAIHLSGYVNGVAKKHREVTRAMFQDPRIESITNGVHSVTWTSEPFRKLFDAYLPEWRLDNFLLRHTLSIPKSEIWRAHQEAKRELIDYINARTPRPFDPEVFTIGFARRVTAYKRADLIFTDPDRLRRIFHAAGPFQIVLAGKAHPQDHEGKAMIERLFQAIQVLGDRIRIVYLPNYGMETAQRIIAGVDLWLNTPQSPLEASGTSGMKAAHNGVPNLSTLDGWWIEGCIEGLTGWAIAPETGPLASGDDHSQDFLYLYDKLERTIIPMFYRNREAYLDVMRNSIALNASFFNAQRMVQEYVLSAYFAS